MPTIPFRWSAIAIAAAGLFCVLFMLQCAARHITHGPVKSDEIYSGLEQELLAAGLLPLGSTEELRYSLAQLGSEAFTMEDAMGGKGIMQSRNQAVEAYANEGGVMWLRLNLPAWQAEPQLPLSKTLLELERVRQDVQAEAARKRDGLKYVPRDFQFRIKTGGQELIFTPQFNNGVLVTLVISRLVEVPEP